MNKRELAQIDRARSELLHVSGFLSGLFGRFQPSVGKAEFDAAQALERAISALTPANTIHPAGAAARCSHCGRYVNTYAEIVPQSCDCGRADGWTRAFVEPPTDAVWSIDWKAVREGKVIG